MESSILVLGAHLPVMRALSSMGWLTQSAPLWAHGAQEYLTVWVIDHLMKVLCWLVYSSKGGDLSSDVLLYIHSSGCGCLLCLINSTTPLSITENIV